MDQKPQPTLTDTMGMEQVIDSGETSGRAVIHYRARPDHCHSGGIVQGGFVTGWIDAAMAHVVIAKSGRTLSPLSLEIKISFLQSAKPGRVIAEGWIERMGKTTAFLEGRLLNEQGDVLAKGTSTARLVPVAPGPLR
ncbi:MAG: PaaI family thioesterase [Alphaproteobacteria bacterium]|nr:PaaI family thioesterase [Alphaproteobacteria bacterium]MBV9904965.1 PaaI family thioesterase [Alphaproteobacteria bacterium]